MSKWFSNKYNFLEHKDEIITDIIKKLVWVPIAAMIPMAWKLITILYNNIISQNFLNFSNVLAIIAIGLAIIAIFVALNLKKPKEDDENKAGPLTDFRIKSLVAELHIKSNGELTSTLDYDMVANKDDVEYFKKSFIWTGDKYNGTKLVSSNSTEYKLEDISGNDTFHQYKVVFNKSIKCQDKVQFQLKTFLATKKWNMDPFYGISVKYQIDKLTLRVVAEPGIISNVKKSIHWDWVRSIRVGEPKPVSCKTIGGNDVYEIEVENPTLLYKYFLGWDFIE